MVSMKRKQKMKCIIVAACLLMAWTSQAELKGPEPPFFLTGGRVSKVHEGMIKFTFRFEGEPAPRCLQFENLSHPRYGIQWYLASLNTVNVYWIYSRYRLLYSFPVEFKGEELSFELPSDAIDMADGDSYFLSVFGSQGNIFGFTGYFWGVVGEELPEPTFGWDFRN
jgi:hypothetical protein